LIGKFPWGNFAGVGVGENKMTIHAFTVIARSKSDEANQKTAKRNVDNLIASLTLAMTEKKSLQ
jgi:Holliday junction resolvase RusA-like endonuclease